MVVSVIGFSVPVFVVGYMLIYVFSINLRWLPVQGYSPIDQGLGPWIERLILPSIALGLAYVALIARITRTSMLEVLAEDYIRTARAKGVATRSMLLKHALKNAGVPIVTVIGIGVALLIGGVVITETVFNIPGIGRLVVDAISKRDYPIIQGVILIFSGVYVLVNLAGRPQLHPARSEDPLLSVVAAEPALRRRERPLARRAVAPLRAAQSDHRGGRRRSSASSRCWRSRRRCSPVTPSRCSRRCGCARPRRRTGSAPTISGATCSPARSMARASRCSSASRSRRCRFRSASFIGLMSGYFRKVDAVVMRLMDGLMAIPAILLAIALVALTRASVSTVIVAITIPEVPRVVRLVRAVVLSVREAPYVEAAVAGGTPTWKILLRHILPNTIAPLIVQATYICASAILIEAALSFLGAGTPPEIPTWGNMIAQSRLFLSRAPWTIFAPGIALALVVLAVNLLGDGLRDRLDPRLARRM